MRKTSTGFLLFMIILSSCGPITPVKPAPTSAPIKTATSTEMPSFAPTITATKPAQMWELERSPLTQFYDMTILPNNEIWAVGTPNLVVHSYLSDEFVNKFRYSGIYPLVDSDAFNRVDFLASNDGWATTWGGKIFYWNGSKWTNVLNTNFLIWDMGFSDENNGWAIATGNSHEAIILHWDGRKWQNVSLQDAIGRNNFYLWSMDAISNTDVWAVGVDGDERGVVLNWDGKKWQEIPYPGNEIKSVSGISQTDVWGVGGKKGNVISHWDGETWTETELPTSNFVNFSIFAVSKNNVWVGGYDLFHWDGSEWGNTFYNASRGLIYDINATLDGEVWALTGEGYILHLK